MPSPLTNPATQSHHLTSYTLTTSPVQISAARPGRVLICQVIGSGTAVLGDSTITGAGNTGTQISNPMIFTDSASTSPWYACATTGTVQLNVDEIY